MCTGLTADVIGRYQACLPREGARRWDPTSPTSEARGLPSRPGEGPQKQPFLGAALFGESHPAWTHPSGCSPHRRWPT